MYRIVKNLLLFMIMYSLRIYNKYFVNALKNNYSIIFIFNVVFSKTFSNYK